MAQFSRPPGDNSTLYEYDVRSWSSKGGGGSVSARSAVSKRPSYAYGAVLPLPGGRTFRKSTSYQNTSYESVIDSAYEAEGRMPNGYNSIYDGGRESGTFVFSTGYTKSLWGGGFHPFSEDLTNEVITKALLDVADSKAGIGEDLLTFRQTLNLFMGKSSLLMNALNLAKHRKEWKKYLLMSSREIRKKPLDAIAQSYLAYVYGLRPLVNDVYGTVEVLKKLGVFAMLIEGRGKGRRVINDDSAGSWSYLSYTAVRKMRSVGSARATCHLYARIDPAHQGLRALSQLGLINPFSLAWEVVPWSFVLDWFVPVGPVLQALSAPAGLIFVDGSIATKTEQSVQYEYITHSTGWDGFGARTRGFEKSAGSVILGSEGYNRSHQTNWPRPALYTISDPFAGDRPLKALALGILQLKRYTP